MKYKACCNRSCLLGSCETRDAGGCYCVCRLKDAESSLISILKGTSYRSNGMVIYEPGKTPIPLEGKEKELTLLEISDVRKKLKEYEIE